MSTCASSNRGDAHVVSGEEIRDDVLRRVVTAVMADCESSGGELGDVVNETIYREESRLTADDAADEDGRAFLACLRAASPR